MEQNVEELTSILFNSLAGLDIQSETLNEFKNVFTQSNTSDVISPSTSEQNIVNDLVPNNENLNLEEPLPQFDPQNVEQNNSREPSLNLNKEVNKDNTPLAQISQQQPGISEDEIVNRITANIEKTLGDYTNDEQPNTSKPTQENNSKPVADKLNNFFNNLSQQNSIENKTTNQLVQPQTKQQAPLQPLIQQNNEISKSKDLLTLDNVQPQAESNLQTLQQAEAKTDIQDSEFQLIKNNLTQPDSLLNINSIEPSTTPSLFNLKNDTTKITTPAFTGYTTNTYEPVLEKYYINEKIKNNQLTPQTISLNDIQNLQKQNNKPFEPSFTQNVNEYNNQTLFNSYNNIENNKQEYLQQPFQKQNIEQFTVVQNALQDNETSFEPQQANTIKDTTAENIIPDNKTNLNTVDTESTESIAEYFDGIDPNLKEILQNTKQANTVLQQITKALPLLAASNAMNNQAGAAPVAIPTPSPSFNMPAQAGGQQNELQEGIPQIPGIRSKFLMA